MGSHLEQLCQWGVIEISVVNGESLRSALSVGSHRDQLCHGESFGSALSMGSH